jgi:hypothetical protein
MKTEYLYAIVDPFGACSIILGETTEKTTLAEIFAAGWRPVRETPFPNVANTSSRILICFDREPEGQMGFGFGA